MASTSEDVSLRKRTGAIVRLDAARARKLVAAFTRPVVATDDGISRAGDDAIGSAAYGWVTLDRPEGDAPAGVLGHYKTHLYLHGLAHLPLSVARQLVRHRGHLYLDRLRYLTDSVAAELAKHPGGGLSLNNLRRLPTTAARALGRHEGELSFKRLRTLSPTAARGLSRHASDLYLAGLERVPSKVAAALAMHRGNLTLEGCTRLSGPAARHLARYRGELHLHGLASLSDAVAEAFGRRAGYLCLKKLRRLSPEQARHLAGHRGPLCFHDLEIDEQVAAWLGCHEGSLVIRVKDGIPLATLAAVAQHRGPLEIDGLETLDVARASVLAGRPFRRGTAGLCGLFLGDVRHLTSAVAAILATHSAGELSLPGIESLTEDVARELVKHPLLALDRVKSLTDPVARILASHSGASLSLRSLEKVSASAIAGLLGNPGIQLPRRFLEHAARGRH